MREFATLDAMRAVLGQEVAVSDWVEVRQERVNQFADATDDHQWIHLDAERVEIGLDLGHQHFVDRDRKSTRLNSSH